MKILKKPDTFLRGPTQEVKIPLSEENNIILDNMIKIMYEANFSYHNSATVSIIFLFQMFDNNKI